MGLSAHTVGTPSSIARTGTGTTAQVVALTNANQPPALIPGAGSFLWHGSVSEHSTRRCQPAPRLRHVERRWGAFVATGLFRPRGAEAPDGSYTGTCRFRTATPVRCAVRPRRRQIAVHLRHDASHRVHLLVSSRAGFPVVSAHCPQCSTQCPFRRVYARLRRFAAQRG